MSIENVVAFRASVAGNRELEAKIRGSLESGRGSAGLVALGAEHGFSFSEQDIEAALANDNGELSEFELEMVAAGSGVDCKNPSTIG